MLTELAAGAGLGLEAAYVILYTALVESSDSSKLPSGSCAVATGRPALLVKLRKPVLHGALQGKLNSSRLFQTECHSMELLREGGLLWQVQHNGRWQQDRFQTYPRLIVQLYFDFVASQMRRQCG